MDEHTQIGQVDCQSDAGLLWRVYLVGLFLSPWTTVTRSASRMEGAADTNHFISIMKLLMRSHLIGPPLSRSLIFVPSTPLHAMRLDHDCLF